MTLPKLTPEHAALLPEPGAPDACYLLDLSSWARGLYERHAHKGVDVDHPDSGALTHRARAAGLRVVLLSLDQDLWQLFETADPGAVVSWDVSGGKVFSAADVERV